MGTQLLAITLLVAAPGSGDGDRDLAELLASIASISTERWDLTFDADTNSISLRSKQRIPATLLGGGNSPFEVMTDIFYCFRVVPRVDERTLQAHSALVREELAKFKELARVIPQEEDKGYIKYYPRTASQWQVVLQVQRSESRLKQFPQYAFKGIYLATTYKTIFQPRAGDRLGEATARDVNRVFALLRPLQLPAATLGPLSSRPQSK